MDPNHDDKHPEADPPVDLDSAIDELEGLLSSHDDDLYQTNALPADEEEDIPVLTDVVESPSISQHDYELAEDDADRSGAEPLPEQPALEREPLLPFEFIDDITPTPDTPEAPPQSIPEFALESGPRPPCMSGPESLADDDGTPALSVPETMGASAMAGAGTASHAGELSPQLLDELEHIIDQELQRVTTEAKQSILATLKAHLDETAQGGLDFASPGGEHFPDAGPESRSDDRPDEDSPPLRPFDPFDNPD